MLHKKVRQEIGLTAVIGAFMLSWTYAAFPALQASTIAIPMAYRNALPIAVENADADRDGIIDFYDKDKVPKVEKKEVIEEEIVL